MKLPLFLLASLFTLQIRAQGIQKREDMMVDGMKRSFVTYVPAGMDPKKKLPLIISLHGGFATPDGQFHLADFRPLADKDHFIIVCPASKHIWHDGRDNKGIDDVKFIDQLISYTENIYHADPDRVYIAGISNGGFLASRLASQLYKKIAAIGVVAATLDEDEGYAPEKPMPVIYMHGTKDKIFSPKGGKKFGRLIYSHNDVIKLWVGLDKCNPKPVVTDIADHAQDGTSIVKEEYSNPANGLKVISYTIVNGGHTWPGGWQYLPVFLVGKTTHNLDACQEMWSFFKNYHLH